MSSVPRPPIPQRSFSLSTTFVHGANKHSEVKHEHVPLCVCRVTSLSSSIGSRKTRGAAVRDSLCRCFARRGGADGETGSPSVVSPSVVSSLDSCRPICFCNAPRFPGIDLLNGDESSWSLVGECRKLCQVSRRSVSCTYAS